MKRFAGVSLCTLAALAAWVKADTGKTLVLDGIVEPSKVYDVRADTNGRLKKLHVDYNVWVKKGALLAEIEEPAGKSSGKSKVFAPGSGHVIAIDIRPGDEVKAKGAVGGTKLLTIGDLDELLMVVNASAADVPHLTPKQVVSCKVDAYPRAQFQGSIESIEPDATDKSPKKRHVVKVVFVSPVDGNGPRLLPGMTGQLSIPLLK